MKHVVEFESQSIKLFEGITMKTTAKKPAKKKPVSKGKKIAGMHSPAPKKRRA